ncbi:cytochrome c oxidase assembly protein subunit 15 [Streptacidiphilus sp. MAP12-16]|uniref:COX15/CtaA family protein n=1 Tax=Streptacidiphilus sp. MAP12-16 TaxID=3156300 RepID=UPI003514FEBA
MRTPFSLLAERVTVSDRIVRWTAFATLVMSVLVVVTGGAVRLTGSGLGCPTWPTCTGSSLATTPAMGVHGVIEFGNRMLTDVLCVVIGAAILAARCAKPWRRSLTRLGWAQFWVTVFEAVWGGVTVLTHLNPFVVAVHFLASAALILIALTMWQRTREGDGEPVRTVGKPVLQLSRLMIGVTAALIVVGTLVTGTGPHSGDGTQVKRMPFDWEKITQFHADFAMVTIGLALAMMFVLLAVDAPAGPRRRALEFFAVLMAQAVIGFVQYFTHLPEVVVGVHLLGAALVWAAVLRLHLSLRIRPEVGALPRPANIETVTGLAAAV